MKSVYYRFITGARAYRRIHYCTEVRDSEALVLVNTIM